MTNIEQLETEIERLVRAHVAACRRAAEAAVHRGFGESRAKRKTSGKNRRSRSRATGVRRDPVEIAALGDRLYEAIVANPGETMVVLAPRVGATPRQLHRPMSRLKRDGRIRSVGQRHQTRYFPMATSTER